MGEVVLPGQTSGSIDVVTGTDGALWFADDDRVGRLAPDRALRAFPVPPPLGGADQIAAGLGAAWFTDCHAVADRTDHERWPRA